MSTPEESRAVVEAFHRLYYYAPSAGGKLFEDTSWMGVPCQKCPLDLWVYQELVFEIRPRTIIETGTLHGGSALFLAHMLDILGGDGRVRTIDVAPKGQPAHPRIDYVIGSSGDPALVAAHVRP